MEILDALQQVGFSQNEAKVYLSLVKYSPQNGYEVAKSSGVTRTMVYDILGRLEKKGFVLKIESEQALYCAVNHKDLIAKLSSDHEEKVRHLDEELEKLDTVSEDKYYVFNLRGGEKRLITQLEEQIKNAKESIYLSIWDVEAIKIKDKLKEAESRGVKIFIFSFCKLPFSCGTQYSYNIRGMKAGGSFPCRRVVAVFDRKWLVIGTGNGKIEDVSILTQNPMLISMAVDQIILDLLLLQNFKIFGGFVPGKDVSTYEQEKRAFMQRLDLPEDVPLPPPYPGE